MAKAKSKSVFYCSSCGHEEPKWLGRCPGCGEWNSFKEKVLPTAAPTPSGLFEEAAVPQKISSIILEDVTRQSTGIPEADQVLGGGLVEGSAVLLGGEPGIGKSTLMLQIAMMASQDREVLYISGEESPRQIKLRANRLGINSDKLILYCESRVEEILRTLEERKPGLVVMDSIQTIQSPSQGMVPGTVNQLKYGCFELINWVRKRGAVLFLIAHVTKDGAIAGPKVIEHMVDTVLYFDHSGSELRVLRATKNRFGSVDEVGLFQMGSEGLSQVSHPEGLFLENREGELPPGISVAPVFEGSRVLLVEIQSLTVPAKGAVSRIFSDRVEGSRVSRVAAIMEKHLGIKFSDQDIYINVAGGMKIAEIGMELPLALAIYSARTGIRIPSDLIALGEMSLTGEIRPVPQIRRRLKAAEEMGFKRILIPGKSDETQEWTGSPPIIAKDIKEAIKQVFSAPQKH
ncbi:DNA repair protein RadA [Oceanispirochaeta crateris]|uniref:DNA repair protein RadA n=1 Tax=Oceanispirochaeta crateris TaxID=2518645 RepID=A0A5C1QN64_9SPIO|nr:DNA repair protein RadA [Oceanispirochaeta crateris]QEN09121.1 DNA repair protein RadA [Oceanispirochaeta crateris]